MSTYIIREKANFMSFLIDEIQNIIIIEYVFAIQVD